MGRRGKELSPQTRSRICELNSIGWGYKRIHNKHPEIPISTIKSTIYNERKRLNNHSLPRSGRPHGLTEEQRDHLYDLTTTNPHIKMRDLLESVDEAVKERSIRRLLNEMGRRKWRQLRRPELSEIHARKCLAWAHEYASFTPEDWAQVRWSDECTVERGAGIQPRWTFKRPSEQLAEHDVHTYHPGKSVKQMFWAAFGEDMCTGLIPLDGDPDAPQGGVNARVIYDLYQAFLPEFIQPGNIFMHDNAPVHRAEIIKQILDELQIQVMVWPPYSPDLNPIENLWAIMKQEIYKLYPELEHAPDTEETLRKLIEAAKEAWHAIDQQVLVKLSATMPHRVKAVIEAKGWYTKY